MQITFAILVVLLLIVSFWEYHSGNVLDIAFTGLLAGRQEAKGKLLRIILVQLFVWIFLLLLIFLTYAVLFRTRHVDLLRIRTYILVIFILTVFPIAMVRKKFASWVAKTVLTKRSKWSENYPSAPT